MQGRADTAGEVMSVHSQHFREYMGSSHTTSLTMAEQIQCEQPFHAHQYFPVLLSPGVCTQMLPFLFPCQICSCSSSQRVKCAFPTALILHHPVIPASSIRGVSPCCFHQDLCCGTLHLLLTGLKKQWLYSHTGSWSMWKVMLRLEDGL